MRDARCEMQDRTDPIGLTRSRYGIRRILFGSCIYSPILTQTYIQSADGPSVEHLEEPLISASAAGGSLAVEKKFFEGETSWALKEMAFVMNYDSYIQPYGMPCGEIG